MSVIIILVSVNKHGVVRNSYVISRYWWKRFAGCFCVRDIVTGVWSYLHTSTVLYCCMYLWSWWFIVISVYTGPNTAAIVEVLQICVCYVITVVTSCNAQWLVVIWLWCGKYSVCRLNVSHSLGHKPGHVSYWRNLPKSYINYYFFSSANPIKICHMG